MFRVVLALLGVSFLVVSAGATIVEVPLPNLRGSYGNWSTRIATFTLPNPPTVVHGASIRIRGISQVRWMECGYWTNGPFLEPVQFEVRLGDDTDLLSWTGWDLSPKESGEFELTIPLEPFRDATWDFLNDAKAEVRVIAVGCPIVDLCWPLTECSSADITEGTLLLDAEIPIPVEPSTWGRVKALFR